MRTLKRWSILMLGWLAVTAGVLMIPLPGPGILLIFCGVAVLSLESARARWLLVRVKNFVRAKLPDIHTQLERSHKEILRRKRSLFKLKQGQRR